MAARLLPIDPIHPEPHRIGRVASALEAGGVIAVPTDSCYGLAADLASKRAIDRIYLIKARDRHRPLSVICADLSEIARYAKVSNSAYRLLRRLTPGPFTFVLEATKEVPNALATKQRTVGIRVPASPIALAIVARLGRPIVSTSAATPEGEPLVGAEEVQALFGHGLALVVDGGDQPHEPSTVLSLLGDVPVVLRQGKGPTDGIL